MQLRCFNHINIIPLHKRKWQALPNLFAFSDEDKQLMSGQGSVIQDTTGTIAMGVVYHLSNSQVALGYANVHVNVVVLLKTHISNSKLFSG